MLESDRACSGPMGRVLGPSPFCVSSHEENESELDNQIKGESKTIARKKLLEKHRAHSRQKELDGY